MSTVKYYIIQGCQDKHCPPPSGSVRSYFLTKESVPLEGGAAKPGHSLLPLSCFGNVKCNLFQTYSCPANLQLADCVGSLGACPLHCSLLVEKLPHYVLDGGYKAARPLCVCYEYQATQGKQIWGPSGKDLGYSHVCYFPGMYQSEGTGHKEASAGPVGSQAGDARANRSLQNATNNFSNGIFLL